MPKINEQLKFFRMNAGYTQKQLAEETGIAEITIRQYESGKYIPKIDKLQKIASALKIDVNILLEEPDNPLYRVMKNSDSPLADEFIQRQLASGIHFEKIDIELIKLFHKLNQDGKRKVIEYASDLTSVKDYLDKQKS